MENGMLEEQKAVVVGGTSGIGLAAATELCRAGAQVWVTGRTPDKAMAAAAAIGDRATGYAIDARDAVKLQDFFARVGEFDHLIVALGGGSAIGAFKVLDEGKMRAGFNSKFWPYLNAIRIGVGHIRRSGSITLITGAAGRRAIKGTSGLAAVNGALQAIVGPLALEFAPIRVNAVSPDSASITVREAADLWIARCERDALELTTILAYRQHVDLHIIPYVGTVKLSRLSHLPLPTASGNQCPESTPAAGKGHRRS
jgi:NAD(P)-dependent dehydrogenase (short-subunit alcohol dehydrogenase family)